MNAYFTIAPNGQDLSIELAPENGDERDILKKLVHRGIFKAWYGRMGGFEGILIKVQVVDAAKVIPSEQKVFFTCPIHPDEGPPSGRRGDDAG